jgi:hypothetical protein
VRGVAEPAALADVAVGSEGEVSKFERVARLVEVTPGQLRDAMNEVGSRRGQYFVSITVKGVQHGRMSTAREGTVLWDVAELLRVEPEDLRDAIATVFDPLPGDVAAITHRVRLLPTAVVRERDATGRFR